MSTRRPFARLLPALGLAVGFILACGGGDDETPEPEPEAAPEVEPAPAPEPEPEPAPQDKSVEVERETIEHRFSFTLKVHPDVKWPERKSRANKQAMKEIKERGWDDLKSIKVERTGTCKGNTCRHGVSVVAIEKKLKFAE